MKNNNSIIFKNNFHSCFIPPITSVYDLDNPKYDSLITILNEVFNELSKDKKFKYDFKFKLFMHSNDKNKNLEFIFGPNLYHKNLIYSTEIKNVEGLAESMLDKDYKYHGYGEIYSLGIDFNNSSHNMSYIKKIIEVINHLIPHINEGYSSSTTLSGSNEFIEFKKWIILDIIRIPISN